MTRRAEDVEVSRVQLIRALAHEGWLGPPDVSPFNQRQSVHDLPVGTAEASLDIGPPAA